MDKCGAMHLTWKSINSAKSILQHTLGVLLSLGVIIVVTSIQSVSHMEGKMDEAPAPKRLKTVFSEDTSSKPIDNSGGNTMSGFKRDRHGNEKRFNNGPRPTPKPKVAVVRNAYTPMFEQLRDELDAHHDRRDRLGKVSRDVTGLSKKM